MKLIGDFLARFNKLTPPDDAVKSAVVAAVQEATNITLSKKAIRIQNETVFVAGSSVMKNTLKIHRGKILEAIYEDLPKSRDSVRDIR